MSAMRVRVGGRWRDRVLTWIEPEDNPSGTIYGTIAAGMVVAAQEPAEETYPRVLVATAVAVASVWLAHGYAHWADARLRRGSDPGETSSARRLGRALVDDWPIIEGGAIPIVALLIAWALGAPLPTAISADLWTAAAALVAFEVAGGLRQRLRPVQLLGNATVGLVLGLTLFAVKMLLH
jgi:hypothetical protein